MIEKANLGVNEICESLGADEIFKVKYRETGIVTQGVKLLSTVLESHLDPTLSPACSSSNWALSSGLAVVAI